MQKATEALNQLIQEVDKHLNICQKEYQAPKLESGATRDTKCLLLGLRFFVFGNFKQTTNQQLEKLIAEMGGIVLSRSSAEVILKRHTITPHCYILLQDTALLENGTSGHNKQLSMFSGGDWKFLSWKYIKDMSNSPQVLDIETYLLDPSSRAKSNRINGVRPLFRFQTNAQSDATKPFSAISA